MLPLAVKTKKLFIDASQGVYLFEMNVKGL